MRTTWIVVGVGVTHLAILDSQFKSLPKFFGIFGRQQSNSTDSAIVFYQDGFYWITWFPKEVSQFLHVNLRHPACHSQFTFDFLDLFFNIFDCSKNDSRLFVVALNCEGLSTSCLAIAYNCHIFTNNRLFNDIFSFPPYNFLVSVFRKGLVKGINFLFVIGLDWLSLV
jgi:hypothetical protein